MLKQALSGGLIALNTIFGTQAQAEPFVEINSDNIFPTCQSMSGQAVQYMPLASDDPRWFGSSVAFAHYDDNGAMIYYDAAIFDQLSTLAQIQIVAHECAHQYLGHTEQTNNFREAQIPISVYAKQRKEKDADCEAVYYMAETYGVTRENIGDVFREIYQVIAGTDRMDPNTFGRMVRAQECHDGFYQRPQAFTAQNMIP